LTPASVDSLPLRTRTPLAWGHLALADPVALLNDHAFLEMKAAQNAMDLMTRWPNTWVPGWVEALTSVARDEAAHLAQVTRVLIKRGGRLVRSHKAAYPRALRACVRNGGGEELLDRLCVSALIEARSCERFAVLAAAAAEQEPDLARFYHALFASEMGHYKIFLKLANKIAAPDVVASTWSQWLDTEAEILAAQKPGSLIHSGI
jgi:tRNA-(ms[2]io[6]A)-hydroxylase